MAPLRLSFLLLILVLGLVASPSDAAALTRRDFPDGFVFGAGTSAMQAEGAAAEDGKKPSIWDTYTHQGYSYDGSTADISADQYHHYKDDVKLMHKMGLDAYRFSIAWPRLIPDGRGRINPKGLEYYNNLIDELIKHGIEPHVTIYHLDLPQSLQDEYDGLLSPRFIDDFTAYADTCFKSFGDRVKNWVTLNEPNLEPISGFDTGVFPPQRCSYPFGANCTKGNSMTEPYLAGHHLLLAHASAVSLYRDNYQATQRGNIGITLSGPWYVPATNASQDVAAAMRMNDFSIGWFLHPLVYGDYPQVMRSRVGTRLPELTAEQAKKVSGSFDFIGLTFYYIFHTQANQSAFDLKQRDYYADTAAITDSYQDFFKGRIKASPWALRELMEHIKLKYRNPPVLIHEIGFPDPFGFPSKTEHGDGYKSESLQDNLEVKYDHDDFRSEVLQDYLEALYLSVRNGSDVQGFFVWSFLDVFEFLLGYSSRFGLCGVDMSSNERTRYMKNSARWYSGFLKGGELRPGKAYSVA
uniref:Uncharacterized protein n=1 Tax=Avena sativa TaxID=4498 RepID=A0ACD5XTW8_AVESA